ncbi:hypothetical protein [Leptospira noguchii]|uniref:hypothetical protein n=1 Tax=Leptospira noguchii TaxID=28182 RepID=UPI00055A69B8|nr:hypothetical protein [Leptospira noguchii]
MDVIGEKFVKRIEEVLPIFFRKGWNIGSGISKPEKISKGSLDFDESFAQKMKFLAPNLR